MENQATCCELVPDDGEAFLRHLFHTAVTAADPRHILPAQLPALMPEWFAADRLPPAGRLIVIGAGKAAAAMAQAVENSLPDDRAQALAGVVVTRYGYGLPGRRIDVIEAAHPVPDLAGLRATEEVFARLAKLTPADTVLALISGGASALLAAPREGLTLAEKRAITRDLLASGASIHEINCVRKHLSTVKGGQLALRAAPARLVTLGLSDVTGDDPAVIGSGPTVADPTCCADALDIADRYRVALPPLVRDALKNGAWETPKPTDGRLAGGLFRLIGSAHEVLQKISANATLQGITPLLLGDAIEGEAREVARVIAGIALSCQRHGVPVRPPCLILSGGETTVTVRGKGKGGRNAEFLLALAVALRGAPGISGLAADTDGMDGTEANAGAFYRPAMLAGDQALGAARRCLADNDAWSWFSECGGLVVSGPTCTNVNDFRAVLIMPR